MPLNAAFNTAYIPFQSAVSASPSGWATIGSLLQSAAKAPSVKSIFSKGVGGYSPQSLLGGGGEGAMGMSGKQYLAAQAIPALAGIFSTLMGSRSQSQSLSSQEQMMREQMAMQERILAEQRAAQEKYNEQMAEQFRIQQHNAALEREMTRQQFERRQGFEEQAYNERKAAARPYYDYVWKYLNTPLK